jgi:hypothetical protein
MGYNYYIVTHEHKYGPSVYLVKSDHYPDQVELCKKLDIDFEPDKDEYLYVDGILESEIITL